MSHVFTHRPVDFVEGREIVFPIGKKTRERRLAAGYCDHVASKD
jgi:hypothetical protein